jgi:uncharacterized protein YjbJ (UPF0337 family)
VEKPTRSKGGSKRQRVRSQNNDRLKREGKLDQAVGKVKDAAEKVVDKVKKTAKKAVDKVKDA